MKPQDVNNHSLPQIVDDSAVSSPAIHAANDPTQVALPEPVVQQPQVVDDGIVAEDVELIEKAWVEKAKAIVQSTVGDPYRQNEEITKMKEDYIKKRYNKDLKAEE